MGAFSVFWRVAWRVASFLAYKPRSAQSPLSRLR